MSMKWEKIKFWLIVCLILFLVLIAAYLFPVFLMPPGKSSNYELFLTHQFSNILTVLCTALILYHLKFHK